MRRREWVVNEPAYILDYLPYGRMEARRRGPLIQLIGENTLRLIEAKPKIDVFLKPHDKIELFDKEKVERVFGYIKYSELSEVAKTELPYIVEKIVEENEKRFVDFFNKATPITTRLHQLELLPGIGKRLLWKILEEREKKPFESFEDIKERIPQIGDVKKMIIERILEELMNENIRHRIFVGVKR